MMNKTTRNRQYSATRLSYSRNKSSIRAQNISPAKSVSKADKKKLCDHCFNRQIIKKHKIEKKHNEEPAVSQSWALIDNKDSKKSRQILETQLNQVNQYNLKIIHEHEKKKQAERQMKKQPKIADNDYEIQLSRIRQKNEDKRMKLKEDLQRQIIMGKRRRQVTRQHDNNNTSLLLFKPQVEISQKRHELELQYKEGLLQQINEKKHQKQRQMKNSQRGEQNIDFGLWAKQDEKKAALTKLVEQNKQNLKAQLKKREQLACRKTAQILKEREQQVNERLMKQREVENKLKRQEIQRKDKIERYVDDLKKQIKENRLNRERQYTKLHTEPIEGEWVGQASKMENKCEPCTCCTKSFPKQFLSQL